MKKLLIAYSTFCLIIIFLLVSALLYIQTNKSKKTRGNIDINSISDDSIITLKHDESDVEINLEVALSMPKREEGLMFRKELSSNSGMIFISEREGEMTFWMKNTLISLDMIYLDKNLKVVTFYNSTKPNQTKEIYPSNGNVLYGIEVNSGWAKSHNLKVGDTFSVVGIN